ncbi:hypothetical protein [Methylobacterium iners]|uniref:Uncharacterized protein n=1 Tax=Methylobacterium iners TaxID=418707 RepID=A0ABQ4S0E9_9HYPH|nr:hypothetical protein [Methylobacterium iners]GJD95277.1 hypothetical protein OCOJLMKI_2488 [Methylobacterium iners]
MRSLVLVLLCLAGGAARAEGFAVRDLTTIEAEARAALDRRFVARAEPKRLTLTCPECEGAPMIDILLGRQDDGTEGRVRSGQTTMARMEAICQARSPDCRLSAISVAPAVGWITTYAIGSTAGSTAILLRDGDLLTIRSLAGGQAVASKNARTLAASIAPRIVGR